MPTIAHGLATAYGYHSKRSKAVFWITYASLTDFMGFINLLSCKPAISMLGISENVPNASIKYHFPLSGAWLKVVELNSNQILSIKK